MDNSAVESQHHVITREDKGPASESQVINQFPEFSQVKNLNTLIAIGTVPLNNAFDLQNFYSTPLCLP